MIMMIKRDDDCYELYMQHPIKLDKILLLSRLRKKDYDFMLSHLCLMRDNNEVGYSYTFPRHNETLYTILRIYHRGKDDWTVDANLGSRIFSEMVDIEFAMMVFELECLPNHQCGTPVYFPPPKEKDNDD